MDKKAFQNFVKKFRGKNDKFPMAMMYGSQVRKGQATINCGKTSKSGELVKVIEKSPNLKEFLQEHKAQYRVERRLDQRHNVISQIRIYY